MHDYTQRPTLKARRRGQRNGAEPAHADLAEATPRFEPARHAAAEVDAPLAGLACANGATQRLRICHQVVDQFSSPRVDARREGLSAAHCRRAPCSFGVSYSKVSSAPKR